MSRESRHQVAFHWVKTKRLPVWPCFTIATPPKSQTGKVTAFFFGKESPCQVKWKDLVPFLLDFQKRSNRAQTAPFATAVTHAVSNFIAFHSLSDKEFAEQAGVTLPALRRLRERRTQQGFDVYKVIVADELPKAAAKHLCAHLVKDKKAAAAATGKRGARASKGSAASGGKKARGGASAGAAAAATSDDADGLISADLAFSRVQAVLADAEAEKDDDGVLPLATQRAILTAAGDCIFAVVPRDGKKVLSVVAPRVQALRPTMECIPGSAPVARRKAILLLRSAVAGADLKTQESVNEHTTVHNVVAKWLREAVHQARTSSDKQKPALIALAKTALQYFAELPHRRVEKCKEDVCAALRECSDVPQLEKSATNFFSMMLWRQWIGHGRAKISELASKEALPTKPPTGAELAELFPDQKKKQQDAAAAAVAAAAADDDDDEDKDEDEEEEKDEKKDEEKEDEEDEKDGKGAGDESPTKRRRKGSSSSN